MSTMVKLENTSSAALYLTHTPEMIEEGGKQRPGPFTNEFTNVPRATKVETTDDAGGKQVTVTNGSATIDADVWNRIKNNKIVAAYLSSGRLRVAGSSGPPTAQASNAGAAGGKGGR